MSASKGVFDNVSEGMSGFLGKILDAPDSVENPARRKVARTAFCLGVVALGVIAFLMMNGGLGGDIAGSLANPGVMSLMSMPMALGISGIGITWLLEDLIPQEHHRIASKVSALLMPLLMAGGVGSIMFAGFQHGWAAGSFNAYFIGGVIVLPMTLYAAIHAYDTVTDNRGHYYRLPQPPPPPPVAVAAPHGSSRSHPLLPIGPSAPSTPIIDFTDDDE